MSDTNLVVVQLSGGNDYLNTLVPYADGRYYDYRRPSGCAARTSCRSTSGSGCIPAWEESSGSTTRARSRS